MPTKYKKFRPDRNRFLFNIKIQNKDYGRKLAAAKLRNVEPPKEDELFSSWLARNAALNFMQTSTFVNKYFLEYKNKLLNRDMDVLASGEIIENFAKRTGIDPKTLAKTSLKSYSGYLSEAIVDFTRNGLISPIKVRGTYNNLHGLRYCPLCLQEDDYFRKEWRLAFYGVCLKHKTVLLDRCPHCGSALTITKRKRDVPFFNCWNCGFLYREAEAQKVPNHSKSLALLQNAMKILQKGYFRFDGRIYYSIAYFKIVKQIAKLIYQMGYRNCEVLHNEEKRFETSLRPHDKTRGHFLEEIVTLKESIALFSSVFHILSSKRNLERFIVANEIPYNRLIRDLNYNDYVPFFYEKIIWKRYGISYSPTHREVKNAIRWMKRNNISINWTNLRRLFGVYLDCRKRPELVGIIN